MQFDGNEPTSSQQALPSVLFATEGGALAQASCSSGSSPTLEVSSTLIEPGQAAINSFDVEAGAAGGRDIVCVTDSCELLYIRRGA